MKFFRYRQPSLSTLLGITRTMKRVNRALGITAAIKQLRALTNTKRTVKRRVGYEGPVGRVIRNGAPRPIGLQGSGFLIALFAVMVLVGVLVTVFR